MAVHFVTGKLGGGKSLVSVGKIKEYLLSGKKVATNLDLYLEHLIPRNNKTAEIYRLPDKPTIEDLNAIGKGTNSKHDEDFGLLVLDELGTWLNSRTYQKDAGRQAVIDWFLHSRHLGWDVLLIVQDPDLIDKQIRIALGEHIVFCRRTDRIPLPVISTLVKVFTGKPLRLPRVHVGSVFYGAGRGGIKVDTWVYRGLQLFKGYDTSQIFEDNNNRVAQFIPPYFLNQKRFAVKNMDFYMRITKIYWKRFKSPLAFGTGLVLNFVVFFFLFGFSGQESVANSNIDSSEIEKKPAIVASSSPDRGEVVASSRLELKKIPYGEIFKNGRKTLMLFYEGEMYPLRDYPVDIVWRGETPYYYGEPEETEDKPSKTENLISSFID